MVKKKSVKQSGSLNQSLSVRTVFACRWFNITTSTSLTTRQFPGPLWLFGLRHGLILNFGQHIYAVYREEKLAHARTIGN